MDYTGITILHRNQVDSNCVVKSFGMGGNQGDGIALGHLRQHRQEQPLGRRRHGDGFGIIAAAQNLNANAGAPAELVRGEAVALF